MDNDARYRGGARQSSGVACLVTAVLMLCVVHTALYLQHSGSAVLPAVAPGASQHTNAMGFDSGSAKAYAFLAELGHSVSTTPPAAGGRPTLTQWSGPATSPLPVTTLARPSEPSLPLESPLPALALPDRHTALSLPSLPAVPVAPPGSPSTGGLQPALAPAPAPAPARPKKKGRKSKKRSGSSRGGGAGSSGGSGGGGVAAIQRYAKQHGVEVLRSDANVIGRAYDFGCSQSEKHSCACQVLCDQSGACRNAVQLCAKQDECKYMLMNVQGDWATLKRGPTARELELLKVEGAGMDWPDVEALARQLPPPSNPPDLHSAGFGDAASAILEDARSIPDVGLCGAPRGRGRGNHSDVAFMQGLLKRKLGIVALEYRTPATFQNSMRSWQRSGLLDLASEKIALINAPMPVDTAIALRHGFQVIEPRQLPGDVSFNKKNVITIGVAFYHTLKLATSDYVLFLEKDFKVDDELSVQELKEQLLGSIWMIERGVPIIRLRSRKEMGCGTFRDCHNNANKPVWTGENTKKRRRNWWSFFCEDNGKPGARKAGVNIDTRVRECMRRPKLRCFTSWDSNWTLNAVLVDRKAMLERGFTYPKDWSGKRNFGTLAAFGNKQDKRQDGFEVGLLESADWGALKVPLCLSYQGIFVHEEVDG